MQFTTALLTLALAALSSAQQSNVLLGRNVNFAGPSTDQVNLPVTFGACVNLPAPFAGDLSAIAPNSGTRCFLFNQPNCQGAQPPCANGCPVQGRVNDLGTIFFNDQTQSLRCERV
ncbi:hypothetical protein BDV95DRAFT_604365 [Massariosphaeria phaeospora]|uniref:Uncharacterized protein n=1 Tax=Massariosphaeria phaeospora TaxID=100035 RepID=A0A7C8IBV5_9PLEO|nr:hypothetical protein BDV95DRAFT_604365 [Massariosphaeria phaeospora]